MGNKNLAVFNVEYEMPGKDGKLISFKANVIARNVQDDAINFIQAYVKKNIRVISISKLAEIDGVSDKAIEYLKPRI